MSLNEKVEKQTDASTITPAVFEVYLPAVYGKILGIVHKAPIADKLLHKVFMDIYAAKKTSAFRLQTPLNTLLNHARDKSYQTVKALTIFRECCAGASVHIKEKNSL